MLLRPALFCLPLFLGACAATPDPIEPSLPAGQVVGEPMRERDVVRFAIIDADPPAYFDRTELVEATATAVCKKAGCWMQVEDRGRTAMVRWETGCGGKYMFPTDMVGRRVLIQGSFYPKVVTEEELQHLQAEAGEDIDIERDGYEFNASSVLVIAE